MKLSRRQTMQLGFGAVAAPSFAHATPNEAAGTAWRRGIEGQRRADLGDGRYLNPIFPGDYPDPTILKDADDYYATFSSFDATPGLMIWHSRDLVNWSPIGHALERPPGIVFAVDLVKHGNRYFIYIPFIPAPWSTSLPEASSIQVIWADDIRGPWSAPIDLGIRGYIDPGHIVGEDGHRYLFLSGVARVRLSADGLSTTGAVTPAYEGWHYPDDWVTEAYALEGPKLFRRGRYFYLVSAVGGTSGPPTGHMVIVARARSIRGPWENCPHNPIVRTQHADERWWSRGHASAVAGPDGRWFLIYHGYENGFRTLGRQTLLEPIEWDDDGWFRAIGGDLSAPLLMPGPSAGDVQGQAKSDDFSSARLDGRWTLYAARPDEGARARIENGALHLAAKGAGPHDCSPLTQTVGDQAYEISVEMIPQNGAHGGLLLFFNDKLFLGMGYDGRAMTTYRGGHASYWREPAPAAASLHLKIVNDRNIVTFYYSADGAAWTRHGVRSEVSGYNANTVDDLVSLRPALFAAGRGEAIFRSFRYRALP